MFFVLDFLVGMNRKWFIEDEKTFTKDHFLEINCCPLIFLVGSNREIMIQ
jgi:hypothetical protein